MHRTLWKAIELGTRARGPGSAERVGDRVGILGRGGHFSSVMLGKRAGVDGRAGDCG